MNRLITDLLIVGGGVAGLNAALSAVERGARVIVTDKGRIERSGNIGGGVDHFLAYLETGPEWDTREAYLRYTCEISRGAADPQVVEAVYCDELRGALDRLEAIGVPLRQRDGTYLRTRSFGQPGPYWINFNGKEMKPRLAAAVRAAGCTVLDRVVIGDLLVREGSVLGAVGFHLRSGEVYLIRAGAVILAAGGTNRIYLNPTGLSFNTWLCPVNTGDAAAMSLRAGAALANMEYMRMTLVPKGLSAAGLNAFMGMGAKLVNAKGEAFMERYDPRGTAAPRYKLVEAVLQEFRAGRGPIYLDCRHLAPEELAHLNQTLGYDKDTLPDFLRQKGLDLSRDLLEITVSEGMQGGPSEVCGSGVKIDGSCRSSIGGLYAAGNCADQCRSLHMAVTSGIRAGICAAEYAREQPVLAEPDGRLVQDKVAEMLAPLGRKGGIGWREFEEVLQRVITEGLGPRRTGPGLQQALAKLERLTAYAEDLAAQNYHDLCRVLEVKNMVTVGKAMATAALFRTESRFGISHHREDYPATDDAHWLGQVVLQDVEGSIVPRFAPLRY